MTGERSDADAEISASTRFPQSPSVCHEGFAILVLQPLPVAPQGPPQAS